MEHNLLIRSALASRFSSRIKFGLVNLLQTNGVYHFYVAGGCINRKFWDVDIFPHPDFVKALNNAATWRPSVAEN